MKTTDRRWDGGFVRVNEGRDVYIIRRQVGGKRYEVSTRCSTSAAAHEQLKRFEADPEGYTPSGRADVALPLNAALSEAFLKWSRGTKRNTIEWATEQRRHLAWWAERLGGKDLRRVTLEGDILPALRDSPSRPARIAVIKVLYSWLLSEGAPLPDGGILRLQPKHDPTFRTLKVPQARPEQWIREKAVPLKDVRRVLAALEGHWRDGAEVLAGTGWHVTELVRFVRDGRIEPVPGKKGAVALVCPQTKGGEPLKTAVGSTVGKAAARLRERGTFNKAKFYRVMKKTVDAMGLDVPLKPGRFRHSVSTHAVNSGADVAAVSAFLNQKSPRTNRRFYSTHAIPAKVPTLR